jgi:cysteine-rich repeat protein
MLVALGGCLAPPSVTPSKCGDGFVDEIAGEECDDGDQSPSCDVDCTFAVCGDTHANPAAGEECDDGNAASGDGCSSACRLERCGDGVVDEPAGEQCDAGGQSPACDVDCTFASCGDGLVNAAAAEECDDGDTVSGDGCSEGCRIERCDSNGSCRESYCGDGVIDEAAGEECDAGNVETADCDLDCTSALCGDGHVNPARGESCDDGNTMSGDGCSAACRLERCGDGTLDPGEICDDGNQDSGDGCSADCRSTESCGNGIRDSGEACDTGGVNTATCDADCTAPVCGDRWRNEASGEACDEGGVDTATCNMSCTPVLCGDGHVNRAAGEDCETGGASIFCDGDCTFAWCGDGTHNATAGEACDDGNADDGDWCLATCERASCEDGLRNGDEEAVDCGGHCDACLTPEPMVVTGANHTCALLESGAVRCWGESWSGQLGYGNDDIIGDDETPATAGDVDVGGRVVRLAAGADHTCALLDTGAVRCWGAGRRGRLGYGNEDTIGDDESPATAGDVNVGGRVVQIAAGGDHTCALLAQGAVRCWGNGRAGRLGYGNTKTIGDNETPATAGNVDVGGRVVQLAAGGRHTCALLEGGTVRCWGRGEHGRLGYGNEDEIGDDEAPATAGDVNVGGRVVQLAAGGAHTCALLEGGTVRCWGRGEHGQLGYGNRETIGDDEAPATAGDVDVGGLVVQLTAGDAHTCALLETGKLRCWGEGEYGRLGHGFDDHSEVDDIGNNETPAEAGDVDVGRHVVQVAAGGAHTCALLETGAVRCWGAGWSGQLGYGNTNAIGDGEPPLTAGDVTVDGGHDGGGRLAAGDNHTCVLLETGAVRCWGEGSSGQLGYGNMNAIGDGEPPLTAGDVVVGDRVLQVATGWSHTCALLEGGAVRCWGAGWYGQLGYGNTKGIGDTEAPWTAGEVDVGGRVVQLAVGEVHTCALLEGGAVRCWGAGWSGQLGYGNQDDIGDDETPATAGDVDVGGAVVQVAAGAHHTCALLETDAVRCWGLGWSGQLGYGNEDNIGDDEVPATIGDVDVGGPVEQLAAGAYHTCALLKTGAVRCWGAVESGRLGYGNEENIGDDEEPATAGDVDVGGPVVQLAAGSYHTCALLGTGAVRCWGRGDDGQLGYGNEENIGDDEEPATAGDVDVGGLVVQVAAGEAHTCALLDTGAVRCWGDGEYGQLGYGNTSTVGDDEAPAMAGDVDVGDRVVQVAAGDWYTCAVLQTGAVRCWGTGWSGELGYGNRSSIGDNETPAMAGDVSVSGRAVQLATGGDHTCALLLPGAVRCWGNNERGQLGYGNEERIGDDEEPWRAGDVNVGGRVVQLAAGADHTCALLDTGAVRCWGSGEHGQLGHGNTGDIGDDEEPAAAGDVNVGGRVIQLIAGGYHTCALLETRAVRCWGAGWAGQLGYGNENTIGDDEAPAMAGDVDVGGRVRRLAAGGYHTCARLEGGAVRCWGDGGSGQLGYGNPYDIGDDEAPVTAGDVDVGGRVVQLAAGGYHTCARLETGAVRCWGAGESGRLGYGNTNPIGDDEEPATAGDVDAGSGIMQLAAGDAHTCVLTNTGAVRCWGHGESGQLGYGNTSDIGDNETPASAGNVPYR